ncbi:MAG: CvpA family protein [Bacilli bacterium]|nr:CvpA family protein [Bacilli bacterium]
MDFGFFGVIDVVIVALVLLFLVLGWKHGFLTKVIEMASSIFGLIASILLARPFSTVLDGWFGESMRTNIYDYLSGRISEILGTQLTQANLPEALAGLGLPDFMANWIVDSIDFNTLTTSITDAVTNLVLSLALLFLAFLILFFGSMIVFWLLKLLAKGITSIPIIKQVDKILGVLFGALKVGLLIEVLLFILALVINIPAINDLIYPFLDKDMQLSTEEFRLSKYLYDNNILQNIIGVFVSIV